MRELLMEFERALRARNLSASQASMQAVGSKELIREMRRGRVPSVERVRALCEVLDLEFHTLRRPAGGRYHDQNHRTVECLAPPISDADWEMVRAHAMRRGRRP